MNIILFQLAAYIANLSPDEIKNKQDLVLQHVQQEAIKNGLSELEVYRVSRSNQPNFKN